LLTGETHGYYADFAEAAAGKLARALSEGFVYQGEASRHRGGATRGTPSHHLPPTCFVNFVQNHDQIGNRPLGERLITMAPRQALAAAVALTLLSPQIPMIFMGEETGCRSPFLYFTDHNDELAPLVREGRRSEFSHFHEFVDPDKRLRIPDPNAISTFEDSIPREAEDTPYWKHFYAELIALRHRFIVPRLRGAISAGAWPTGSKSVMARWQLNDCAMLTVQCNLGDENVIPIEPEESPIMFYSTVARDIPDGTSHQAFLVAMLQRAI
jgi:1,4-alpha-glucan branching enzyme